MAMYSDRVLKLFTCSSGQLKVCALPTAVLGALPLTRKQSLRAIVGDNVPAISSFNRPHTHYISEGRGTSKSGKKWQDSFLGGSAACSCSCQKLMQARRGKQSSLLVLQPSSIGQQMADWNHGCGWAGLPCLDACSQRLGICMHRDRHATEQLYMRGCSK